MSTLNSTKVHRYVNHFHVEVLMLP